ncbi:5-oxoprolinase subunit PxpB [Piscinibacter sakaiensis]|uniref:5-oxoprolinase subunit PxpB n=1 Tax=Piscinibacter sakaiensis TaxID=1547922 RepID=UPI003AAF84CA
MAAEPDVTSRQPRLLDAGDAALTIEFGDVIDPALLGAVASLDQAIAREQAAGRLPGLVETMPTFRSLTVFFDPLLTGRAALVDALRPLFSAAGSGAAVDGRHWRLPVCYEGDAGPDLAETAQTIGCSIDEVIALHSQTEVMVYMLGFLPGCPFMGDVAEPLRLPRRSKPRVRVPAGSVAVAAGLTTIYPWESPGGWHLLGRCPVPLFDGHRESPSLLAVGDSVRFESIGTAEYQRIAAAVEAGEVDPGGWLDQTNSGAAQ